MEKFTNRVQLVAPIGPSTTDPLLLGTKTLSESKRHMTQVIREERVYASDTIYYAKQSPFS